MSAMSEMTTETLFDFTTMDSVKDWYEISDTVRQVGQSKATFVLQKTKLFQRGVFFVLLNPQPNGACFAGMNSKNLPLTNWSNFQKLKMKIRSQAANFAQWKIVLRTSASVDRFTTYQQEFPVENNSAEFQIVTLDLSGFHQFVDGNVRPDEVILDKTDIQSFGFQAFGGVYEDFKQSGPATLEIDYVKLVQSDQK